MERIHFARPPLEEFAEILASYERVVSEPYFQRLMEQASLNSAYARRRLSSRGLSDRQIHETQAEADTWGEAATLPVTYISDMEKHYGDLQQHYEAQQQADADQGSEGNEDNGTGEPAFDSDYPAEGED